MGEEQDKILRILDANANRAREGLRVVEDYCRFVLDNEEMSAELRKMRHDVTQRVNVIVSRSDLLGARDSESDVGAGKPEAVQSDQAKPAQVVVANIKRAEEALRCLEEYSKALDATCAENFKQIRFELYTLEKKLTPILDYR